MKKVKVKTWEKFEERIKELKSRNVLFRGQANSNWKLETTLDRFGFPKLKLMDYYRWVRGHTLICDYLWTIKDNFADLVCHDRTMAHRV